MAQRRELAGEVQRYRREQRVCSSSVAALHTANTLLEGRQVQFDTKDEELTLDLETEAERSALVALLAALDAIGDDPKLKAIRY